MNKYIKNLDLLGPRVELYFNGSQKIQSRLGAFLTIILFLVTAVGSTYYLVNLFGREDSYVSINKIYEPEFTYYLNTSQDVFAFRLASSSGGILPDDEQSYSIIAQHQIYYFEKDASGKNVKKGKVLDLKFSKCGFNYSLDSPSFKALFSNFDFGTRGYYCLDKGQIIEMKNPILYVGENSYINIMYTYCSGKPDCKSPKELDQALTTYFSEIITVGYYTDNNNYKDPIQYVVNRQMDQTSSAFFRRANYYMKNTEHITDDNIILNSEIKKTFQTWDTTDFVIDFRNTNMNGGKLIYQLCYALNKNGMKDVVIRKYKKIQNLFAEIGGFINFLKLISCYIIHVYCKIDFVPSIYKNFEFNYFKQNILTKKEIIRKKSSLNPNPTKMSNITCNTDNLSLTNRNVNIDQNVKEKSPTSIEIAKIMFCFSKNKKKIYREIRCKLEREYLELSNLVLLRNEVNILVNHLFSSNLNPQVFKEKKYILEIFENSNSSLQTPLKNTNLELQQQTNDNSLPKKGANINSIKKDIISRK